MAEGCTAECIHFHVNFGRVRCGANKKRLPAGISVRTVLLLMLRFSVNLNLKVYKPKSCMIIQMSMGKRRLFSRCQTAA